MPKLKETSKDFERFYPTDVMETGYDILPFWVMRMLLMGLYRTDKVPFRSVYLHGLIRDDKGRKMSKSLGNIINPLDVTKQYGADALRMALVIRSTPGQDKSVGEGDVRAMRNLTNKVWNAARYIILNQKNSESQIPLEQSKLASGKANHKQSQNSKSKQTTNDTSFLKKLYSVADQITKQLEDFRIGLAAETAYNEFWHWFCDECIERNKRQEISDQALLRGLIVFLKLLHPFVPFVTEAVYQELNKSLPNVNKKKYIDSRLLISSEWPHFAKAPRGRPRSTEASRGKPHKASLRDKPRK